MQLSDIPIALTGDSLIEQIGKAKDRRKALVEGFIYEQTILMVSAPPGLGKSTISSQVAIECAAGLPIFGMLQCHRPLKVLYCQTERPILEFLERAEIISKTYSIAKENLVVTDAYKIFNLLKEDHLVNFIKCVMRDCPDPDVIFLDPIYPLVSGGLSKDEPASAFCKAISMLQKYTKASIYLNHHTSRPTQDRDGFVVQKDDPFYGSQWLKALVTGSYSMTENERGVSLNRKKDNYRCLREAIHLEYDGSTELSHIPIDEIPSHDKIKSFIRAMFMANKNFTFSDIAKTTNCCNRTVRRALETKDISSIIELVETKKSKNYYRAKEVVSETT